MKKIIFTFFFFSLFILSSGVFLESRHILPQQIFNTAWAQSNFHIDPDEIAKSINENVEKNMQAEREAKANRPFFKIFIKALLLLSIVGVTFFIRKIKARKNTKG